MNYEIEIERYCFIIKFDINNLYQGFYWKAISEQKEEIGYINFHLVKNKNNILMIETSFTPEKIEIFPKLSVSKYFPISHTSILPGRIIFKFVNFIASSSTLQLLGGYDNSFHGEILTQNIHLNEIGMKEIVFDIKKNYDLFFIKKSNFSQQPIKIGSFTLLNNNKILNSNDTLIKPENSDIYREEGKIVFNENSPIWSFFSIKFTEN